MISSFVSWVSKPKMNWCCASRAPLGLTQGKIIWHGSLCFVLVRSQLEENVAMALSSTHGKVVMTTSNPNPTNPTRALTPQFGNLSAHRPKDLSFAQLWIWGLTPTPITMQLTISNLKPGVKWWQVTPFVNIYATSQFHSSIFSVFFFDESFLLE